MLSLSGLLSTAWVHQVLGAFAYGWAMDSSSCRSQLRWHLLRAPSLATLILHVYYKAPLFFISALFWRDNLPSVIECKLYEVSNHVLLSIVFPGFIKMLKEWMGGSGWRRKEKGGLGASMYPLRVVHAGVMKSGTRLKGLYLGKRWLQAGNAGIHGDPGEEDGPMFRAEQWEKEKQGEPHPAARCDSA